MCKRSSLLFILLLLFSSAIFAQSRRAQRVAKKREKEAVIKKQEKEQEIQELTEFLKDKHFENQTKEVQKRMVKSQRKARRTNKNKKKLMFQKKIRKKRKKLINLPFLNNRIK